ncbi:Negative regulator of beta-lactamase expression [Phaeobacter gallaeciensis]|uniref:N-acetylmuramoyl-L-alanine amidase n=2 Tax=Phaeobacter gallaeciensis TaxID=60890 RepID=A0AAD0EAT1_9RHOB|nr:Negative regulator of beta-lactamase expression [Phaeobacter gallaeciensis DSM 26640]ATE92240.1 Negative regulator of beta-lactamase expression [Phaeobacter gallaeciensis]ATE97941.1 Negative regulator of beta-lactamase expression [Phaeobacter gallaeciensis]ATF00902.1 Negative regulator of beta-lactamase expression [Phaeobacter gallaeciensis]ATF05282.1 Negative regulator of beta-lactamase expression [Phaeobacter gallaeciensis]
MAMATLAVGIQRLIASRCRTDAGRRGVTTVPCMPEEGEAAIWHPSPNFNARRNALRPELVVLHYTALESAEAALDRLCDPQYEVSAHYLIGADGMLWQMVREADRAWHAGAGEWCGQGDINSRSIGIELDNRGDHPFSASQMARLETLLSGILQRWEISPTGVIGHSCMAPGRKYDPGPRFDWARLARQGLAAPVPKVTAAVPPIPQEPCTRANRFRALAQARGFTADVDDATLLQAVRLRFRPWQRGPLSEADVQLIWPDNP